MGSDQASPPSEVPPKDILALMAVDEKKYPNVYFIGGRATRLTFLSQQQRALNLVWALAREGKLQPDTRLAVIGGGLAGVTPPQPPI